MIEILKVISNINLTTQQAVVLCVLIVTAGVITWKVIDYIFELLCSIFN